VAIFRSGVSSSQFCPSPHRYAPYLPDIFGIYAIWIFLGRSGISGFLTVLVVSLLGMHCFSRLSLASCTQIIVIFPCASGQLFPDLSTWVTWPSNTRANSSDVGANWTDVRLEYQLCTRLILNGFPDIFGIFLVVWILGVDGKCSCIFGVSGLHY